ncbi:50S ribosomal protein L7Ae [Candidatus Woesearchaeota archaeon]|nr:50S ribosomal protein L7Ae [Candidatus Woesearchaeota archaeon]
MEVVELPDDLNEKLFEMLEVAKGTGKVRKGTNEVTKALERGEAKLVVIAADVQPPEVIMHLPLLAKEKKVPIVKVKSKEELGVATGITVPTASAAVVEPGDAKQALAELVKKIEEMSK